ncbi:hypothetical protein D3C72_1640720 [compost metagenome]
MLPHKTLARADGARTVDEQQFIHQARPPVSAGLLGIRAQITQGTLLGHARTEVHAAAYLVDTQTVRVVAQGRFVAVQGVVANDWRHADWHQQIDGHLVTCTRLQIVNALNRSAGLLALTDVALCPIAGLVDGNRHQRGPLFYCLGVVDPNKSTHRNAPPNGIRALLARTKKSCSA